MPTSKPKGRREKPKADVYEIRVKGKLSDTLVKDLQAVRQTDSDTSLIVEVPDRAGLHSFMSRIEDLGLAVVSINPARPEDEPSDDD